MKYTMPPIGKRQQNVNPTNVSPAEDVASEDDSSLDSERESSSTLGQPVE